MKKIVSFIVGGMLIASCNNQDTRFLDESGDAKYDKQDYKGAVADYTKAIEANANDTDAYNGRGNAKYELHDLGNVQD